MDGTQEIGWVRFTFDKFGVPFDLIYKERVRKGNLARRLRRHRHADADADPAVGFQPAAARPVPYMKDAKYKFLGMCGESPDITGGMGGEGVDAFAKFLDAGGTLVAMGNAVRFPTDIGFAHRRGRGRRRTTSAAPARQRRSPAPRPSGVLRLHRQDDAD